MSDEKFSAKNGYSYNTQAEADLANAHYDKQIKETAERDTNIVFNILLKIPEFIASGIYMLLSFLMALGKLGNFLMSVFWTIMIGLLYSLLLSGIAPSNKESLIFNGVMLLVVIAVGIWCSLKHSIHISRMGQSYIYLLRKCISICLYGSLILGIANGLLKIIPAKYEMNVITGIPFAIAFVIYIINMKKAQS